MGEMAGEESRLDSRPTLPPQEVDHVRCAFLARGRVLLTLPSFPAKLS